MSHFIRRIRGLSLCTGHSSFTSVLAKHMSSWFLLWALEHGHTTTCLGPVKIVQEIISAHKDIHFKPSTKAGLRLQFSNQVHLFCSFLFSCKCVDIFSLSLSLTRTRTAPDINRDYPSVFEPDHDITLKTWNASNWILGLLSLNRFIMSLRFSGLLMYLVITVKLCLSSRSSPNSCHATEKNTCISDARTIKKTDSSFL